MSGTSKKVLLTFDDGPEPTRALTSILSTLNKNGIKAEFYVLGKEVKLYPRYAKLIVTSQHSIQEPFLESP